MEKTKTDTGKTAKFGAEIDTTKQVFFVPNALIINDNGNWFMVYGRMA